MSQGICPGAVAVDVCEGPLERARENVNRYGMTEKIRLSLSSGLTALGEEDADDIVIAGMGGELIAEIISKAPWVCNQKKHLILQPMTTANELRVWLRENGFALLREECVRSEGKVYSVMLAAYDPEKAEEFQNQELYPYIGLLTGKSEAEQEYIQKAMLRLSKKCWDVSIDGMKQDLRRSVDCFLTCAKLPEWKRRNLNGSSSGSF